MEELDAEFDKLLELTGEHNADVDHDGKEIILMMISGMQPRHAGRTG